MKVYEVTDTLIVVEHIAMVKRGSTTRDNGTDFWIYIYFVHGDYTVFRHDDKKTVDKWYSDLKCLLTQ